jgi:hypothetical protein
MATISHDASSCEFADRPSPLAAIHHHNHRFRIDFEIGESIEQTRRNRERRETFLAADKRFADTAEQCDDDFLLAILETDRSLLRRSIRRRSTPRRLLASWGRPLAIGALVQFLICIALALFSVATPRAPQPTTIVVTRTSPGVREFFTLPPVDFKPLAQEDATPFAMLNDAPILSPAFGEAPLRLASLELADDPVAATLETLGPFAAALDIFARADGAFDGDDSSFQRGAEFFGVQAQGSRFVFVVDSSRSMRGARFDGAVRELIAAVSKLDEGQSFYVVFFDAVPHPMFDLPAKEARFVEASEANIARLKVWAEGMALGPDTEPLAAVKIACRLRPDAIYLLSDGEFKDKTALYLRRNNLRADKSGIRMPAAVVHTIALKSHDGQPLLERIAADNAGRFRFVE